MKRVRSIKKKESKRPQQLIIAGITIFIMLSSVLGYLGSRVGGGGSIKYKNFRFRVLENGMYATTIANKQFRFNFLPQALSNMSFDPSILAPIKQTRLLYTTSEFDSPIKESMSETEYLLGEGLYAMGKYTIPGYTTNTTTQRPVITCENATAFVPVIMLKYSNETKAWLEGNCLIIQANTRVDFLAYKDRILYGLLGVLE
ncbi:hypothetical protein DRJ48_01585 [Candidatus Woesearchaeota archaeon]|nr:hypothetical protein [Candidatus Woesearchaeota archaeon]RLE43179.1 MAG: hypothetical protein DRJ48_01585 [Candidatus Woesearchaeota archaeon]